MQSAATARCFSSAVKPAPQQASRNARVSAQATEAQVAVGETYTVNLPKPIGVRFGRGNDGSAYVRISEEAIGNIDDRIQPGDKVVRCSASFGEEIWDAKNYGQVTYAIKTRSGDIYLELESRGGDLTCFDAIELTPAEQEWRNERAGGNYGAGTKEIQERNYIANKELERKRKEMFEDALSDYRDGKIDEALVQFEEIKGMEPAKYIGDSFERVSRILVVTLYNIACCYSALKAADAGLEALEECLRAGFEDYGKIRSDKNLEFLRADDRFVPMLNKFDEPIINENAVKALKSLFSFGKKD